ncbi:inner nuclear membrane protein enriched at telomere/subtelomere region [Coemansia brasiliensis]|uniref:Inner nuclear membrane protein enriched at telomere/subtelomere region n=1 Tax=Coemansia brasiliensis TaxID=2650707 RepID=A0A9W8IH00_9FUNG|nr:inner nuclear membrane protein enriched at telomere/subtelomere region [Coemansia brasiliensis]
MSSERYLEAGFDYHTLNMPTIRNILNKHEVAYPSNAKKNELLEILQKNVIDKASKLRKEARKQKRVKADGRDIEKVEGTSATTAQGKPIGARTRSQTPRSNRTQPPRFPAAADQPQPASDKEQEVKKPSKKSSAEMDAKSAVKEEGEKKIKKSKKGKKGKRDEDEGKKKSKSTKKQEAPTTPPRAVGKAADVKRIAGSKRKLSDAEQDASQDSGDDEFFTPQRPQISKAQKERFSKQDQGGGSKEDVNFSDENPFQSSPEAARKRRRKASTQPKPATPLSALRKSQTSDVSFKVALPRTSGHESSEQEDMEMEQPHEPPTPLFSPSKQEAENSEQRARVSELVAKYQQQQQQQPAERPRSPTVRIRDGLHNKHSDTMPEPVAVEHPAPVHEQQHSEPVVEVFKTEHKAERRFEHKPESRPEQPKRFTMTPDALRQLAAAQNPAEQTHRRRTAAPSGLPPVAPGIPVPRPDHRIMAARERLAAEPAHESESSFEQAAREAHELQRRRVATLRQHVENAAADAAAAATAETSKEKTHSRRSSIASIASSVGEARGIPAIPAAADAGQSTSARSSGGKGAPSWAVRLLWIAAAGIAAVAWRSHQQFGIGFGSARSEYALVAPPADSIVAIPEMPADMQALPLGERIKYYAQYARAAYLSPGPLECPEHADCVPYTPIPAAYADQGVVVESPARDQWIVPVAMAEGGTQQVAVVQCDAGHVLQFPMLTTRILPMVPRCVRDVSTEHRVQQVVAAMKRECSGRRGRAQCEMTLLEQARELLSRPQDEEDEADEIERMGLSTADLYKAMQRRKSARLTDDEFDAVFQLAVTQLGDSDDVANYILSYEDEDGVETDVTYFVSKQADYPPLCRVQRLVLALVVGNLAGLLALVGAGVLAYVASRRFAAHRAEVQAADALVGCALARLKRQARRHYLDPALSPSPAIPSLQLRDLLLLSSGTPPSSTPLSMGGDGMMSPARDTSAAAAMSKVYYDPRARNSVWERVRKVVERNANVRCRTTAVRGEPMRVWEWIGPLEDEDEDLLSPFASPQRM